MIHHQAGGLYELVWDAVRRIPPGRVASYGQVASLAGLPGRARMVGTALRLAPAGVRIPWHRVINAGGRISFPVGSASYRRQKELLLKERIVMKNGVVDFTKYGIDGHG